MSKVTIELTSQQREQIREETGDEVTAFTWEKLESRDAPKVGGGMSAEFVRNGAEDRAVARGGGLSPVDPAT